MAELQNAVFWIETDKIQPNPYQPRREFDERNLKDLAESIRQYGVLQPLVVTRREDSHDDGSISVAYELIAGERRLRASKLAGVREVPCVVRVGDDNRAKLELAIIENIQREDLNAVDRAKSFQQLADEFKLNWADIGKKVGKSREYVSNTVRILMLPQEILDALVDGKISEGHTRPLLMLVDKPDEQITLFKEMLMRKMTVREAEGLARRVALEKVRKKSLVSNPEVIDLEKKLAESLGTRVSIEPKEKGGKITIDYFSHDELLALAGLIKKIGTEKVHEGMFDKIKKEMGLVEENINTRESVLGEEILNNRNSESTIPVLNHQENNTLKEIANSISIQTGNASENLEDISDFKLEDDRSKQEIRDFQEREDDLYDIRNFSL
ncbi:Nucleoid occlusion protein [bioreactor metagenome]|uniref:Nucleoid occlusion protein n=1 Tax=bioreactor metagenome TaxID=1076179 RepID=A0A644T5U3_9ZZZZ|nr:ParB/RepB/Spo0J family partition protein [Candidatus Elulimicrobiales bacterium]